jgi:phosphatidylglycerol lysyltransferase
MESPRYDALWIRRFFGGLLAIIGALDIIASLIAHHPLRSQVLDSLVPAEVSLGGRTGTVIAGLALLLLAFGVGRGKRVAWQLTMVALVASIVLHLVKDLDFEEAALAAWVAGGLWWMRHHFHAASDPVSVRRGVAVLMAGASLAVLYGVAGIWLLRTELRPGFELPRAFENLALALVQNSNAYDALTDRAAWFLNSLPWIAYGLVLLGLVLVLRPVVAPAAGSAERERLRDVTSRWGHNPVCHLALYGPKSQFWLDGRICVAYTVRGTTALALGDPIAPPEERGRAVGEFMRFCDAQGWTSAFYQVEDPKPFRELGFTMVPVGSDAIVKTRSFNLSGRRRSSVRHAVQHCRRHGVTFRFAPAPAALEEAGQEIARLSASWLRGGKGPQLGFSLGGLDTLHDPDITVGTAFDHDGDLQAFVSWLPVPARKGWTLDLMRRRPDGVSGVMEALIAQSVTEAASRGIEEASLGLAPLAVEAAGPASGHRALRDVYRRLDRFRRSRSLRQFKEKFDPAWEERYLAVSSTTAVPETLLALLRAHLPPLSRLSLRVSSMRTGWTRGARRRWTGS